MATTKITDTIREAIMQFIRAYLGPVAEKVEAGQSAATLASAQASGKKKAPKYVEDSKDVSSDSMDDANAQIALEKSRQPFQREGLAWVEGGGAGRKQELRDQNFQASLDRNRQARALGDRGAKAVGLPLAPKYGRGGYVDAMGVETPSNQDTPQEKKYKAFQVLLEAEGNRRMQGAPRQFQGTSMESKIIALRKMLQSDNPSEQEFARRELMAYGFS